MEDGTDEKGYGRNYMNITYKSDGFAKYSHSLCTLVFAFRVLVLKKGTRTFHM